MNQMTETEVSPSISKPLKVKDQKIMTKAVIPPITMLEVAEVCILLLRVVIPREERGIEEFGDEEFLARKTDEENEELEGLKNYIFKGK